MPDFEADVDGKSLPEDSKIRIHEAMKKAIHEEIAKNPSIGQGIRPDADAKGHAKLAKQM